MARKFLIVGGAGIGIGILVYWFAVTLASDETKIRWMLESLEEAFNDGSARRIGGALAEDFREIDSGLDRQQTILAFMGFVRRNLDAESEFLYRCELAELDDDSISIADGEEKTATVRVIVSFHRRAASSGKDGDDGSPREKRVSTIAFTGDLIVEEGRWKILRAAHELIDGRRPF